MLISQLMFILTCTLFSMHSASLVMKLILEIYEIYESYYLIPLGKDCNVTYYVQMSRVTLIQMSSFQIENPEGKVKSNNE